MIASIFSDFTLPNAATWFYLSLILAVALFFKFSRLLSVRNWDVLALFLLVPGLLLRQEAREQTPKTPEQDASAAPAAEAGAQATPTAANRMLWYAYLWLLCGSAYFLARCLFDLALVRRPALAPNLNLGGLAWLAGALFVCLVVAAVHRPPQPVEVVGKESPALSALQDKLGTAVETETGAAPAALVTLWVGRIMAILCQLAVVAALVFIGWRHFQDVHAGMAAATFYLLLPYSAFHLEQFHHVWPVALLLWAIAAYRQPFAAGLLVGLASGSTYFPVLTLPVWLSFYGRRGGWRFTGAFLLSAGLSLGVVGLILWSDGDLARSLQSALALSDWQPWIMPTTEGFWTGVNWPYRIPVFIAYVAFVAATAFWPAPKNLGHLIALCAAVLIGIQFWYADKGGLYVLWYLPLLLLLVFRPNLSERVPPPIQTESDWLHRLGRGSFRVIKRRLNVPEPATSVH